MSYFSGALNRVSFMVSGTTSYTALSNFRANMRLEDQGHEVTSAGHEGQQAFCASIFRAECSASFHINDTMYPWALLIVPQAKGMFKFESGNRKVTILPVYISVIEHMNETAGGSDWTVTAKLDKEAAVLMGVEFQNPT